MRQKVYPTILHSFLRIRIRLGFQSENLHARVSVLYTHNIVAAPSVWNYLAHPALGLDSCQAQVKDIPLCTLYVHNVTSALEIIVTMRYINLLFIYLLYLHH